VLVRTLLLNLHTESRKFLSFAYRFIITKDLVPLTTNKNNSSQLNWVEKAFVSFSFSLVGGIFDSSSIHGQFNIQKVESIQSNE